MNAMVKPIIVLTLICVISSALLGLTYSVTAEKIEEVNAKATADAMTEVLPGAASFTELKEGFDPAVVLLAAKEDSGAGYVFKVKDKGFGGAFVVMVGIDSNGKVTGAKLLDNQETPGLGSKTADPAFTGLFTGKGGSEVADIQTIIGVTISSNAFKRCVSAAFVAYESVKGGA